MNFTASSAKLSDLKTDCLILPTGTQLNNSAEIIDQSLNGLISSLVKSKEFNGKAGKTLLLNLPEFNIKRLLLVGTEHDGAQQKIIKSITQAAQALSQTASKNATWLGDGFAENTGGSVSNKCEWLASLVARCVTSAYYSYNKTSKSRTIPLKSVSFWSADPSALKAIRSGLKFGAAVGNGMNTARQLGNLPANICTPSYLANQAKKIAQNNQGKVKVTTSVLNAAQMKKLKMGSLLSVAAGSDTPPKLIVINYQGGKAKSKPVVLVGKAVTFDSGGISLKPGRGMDEMKYDMCGGASVLGVMSALIETQLPINVVGIIPATENMPNGRATKPGDVVTSMSGQTIEILNTDAEGRLILCDSLTYAGRFKPDTVIDIATLTGAVIGALGKETSGLMTNDETLGRDLTASGTRSGDRVWELPLWEEYDQLLSSNFADMANIGGPYAGSITAGCFLARFARDYHWAHLDIAGTAWVSGKNKGATGRPVPMLMEYLRYKAS
jgi:leucyl aminopeptidase